MRPRPASGGLTLLEVVLAIVLIAGLMGGLYAFYSYAVDLRRTLGEDARSIVSERIIMDRMAAELRQANILRFLRIGLSGQGDQVQFVTAAVPSAAVWVDPAPDEDPVPPEHDLRLVGYRLRIPTDDNGEPLRNDDGEIIVEGLEHTSQKLLTAPRVEEGETIREVQQVRVRFLSARIKFLNFRYWTGDTWIASWGGGDLPSAIEITMSTRPLPDQMEVEDYLETHETFRQVVYLPAAAKPDTGSVIQRGAAGFGGGRGER